MRTTTKRGLGRGAALNGNGRAVLPPPAGVAVTRYRQPPQPRRGALAIVSRVLVWLLAVLVVVGTGLAGGAYLYYHETLSDITSSTPEIRIAAESLNVALPGEPAVALAIGYDKRMGAEGEETGRSDTVMLMRADPRAKAISTLAFPRDLLVEIRCPRAAPRAGPINSAYSSCGPRGVVDTVRALTGLEINYLITVNFRGFKQTVAKLGGVWLDVDRRYYNPRGTGYASIDLRPGYQKVNGADALDFVRYRHADNDLYRIARQQAFVHAFRQALTSSCSLRDVPKIVGVVRDNLKVGAGGSGGISFGTLKGYGLLAFDLPEGHFFQERIDPGCYSEGLGYYGEYQLRASEECVQEAVQRFGNPDVEAPRKATDVALGRKPKREQAPPASQTALTVLNGNGVPGAAGDAAYLLGRRGYEVLGSGDAPRQDYFHSVIYYDTAVARSEAAAKRLADLFGDAETTKLTPQLRRVGRGAMLVTVLGQTFHGTIAPAPPDRTPRKSAPYVRADPGGSSVRDALRPMRRKVRFPIMVPTVLERTSRPPTDAPPRLYEIAGRRTIRLTFATGANEFYGIQQIAWKDAPAIRGPNEVIRWKGRRLELHYTGPKLRLVVVRRGPNTYWVTNTLVNGLSNETMLAIAKGLRPLGN
jgi:LCP family protein required for cell wall assembly